MKQFLLYNATVHEQKFSERERSRFALQKDRGAAERTSLYFTSHTQTEMRDSLDARAFSKNSSIFQQQNDVQIRSAQIWRVLRH